MNTKHRIRLAGPWEGEIHQSSSHPGLIKNRPKAALVVSPKAGSSPFVGELNMLRRFNLPTGLDQNSVVWICADGLPITNQGVSQSCSCQISLNQHHLDRTAGSTKADRDSPPGIEVPVTEFLEPFNRLEIKIVCPTADELVWITADETRIEVLASVWLEIEQLSCPS